MDLELATLIALLFIAPAYTIQLGMKASARFRLKASALKEPLKTAELLTISSLILICMSLVYISLGEFLWSCFVNQSFIDILKSDRIFFRETSNGTDVLLIGFWSYNSLMYLATLFLGFLSGRCYIQAIEKGVLNFPIHHGEMYQLIVGKNAPVIWCSVLTKIQHEGKTIMYKGLLEDISYTSNNKIDYIALAKSRRYLLTFEKTKTTIRSSNTQNSNVSYFKNMPEDIKNKLELLMIDGEEIANILFSRVSFDNITDKTN